MYTKWRKETEIQPLVRYLLILPAITTCTHSFDKTISRPLSWFLQQWLRVMFFDESSFTVTSDSGHQLLRRERQNMFYTALCS